VIYAALEGAKPTLWKVSMDGGAPVRLSDHVGTVPSISPDGKLLAYLFPDSADAFAPPNKIAVMPLADGTPQLTTFSVQASGTVSTVAQFSTDGKSIIYSVNANNLSNLWSQPLDGSAPRQITDFKDSLLTGFAWSRDGKQLACTRGILMRDAVLISDIR
jgi:Tol biopolymer transport system component